MDERPVERRQRDPGVARGADRRDDPADIRDERRDRVEDRRDYYDDRRDSYRNRRAFVRGARYSSSWWNSSCVKSSIVVVDGYTYYGCDGEWFSRTYYGGEVVYTVVDPPPGY